MPKLAKIEHIVRERDAKLRELPNRLALRASVAPAAFALVSAPTAIVRNLVAPPVDSGLNNGSGWQDQ